MQWSSSAVRALALCLLPSAAAAHVIPFQAVAAPRPSAPAAAPSPRAPQASAVDAAQAARERRVTGIVVDATGQPVHGAEITISTAAGERRTTTDGAGRFDVAGLSDDALTLVVALDAFSPVTLALARPQQNVKVVLQPIPVSEAVTVRAPRLDAGGIVTATRTDTPLRNVPQSISVLSRSFIGETGMRGMADAVRYVPGVGIAQGEGHRDAPIFRGNTSTADFFVDGFRDDTQYLRDLYNVERVEVLKGPNGMIFGRGGVGGVINRVTRHADWTPSRELAVQAGTWDQRRVTADVGDAVSRNVAVRLTGLFEDSGSYRAGASLERYGINPTVAVALGPNTTLRTGYEHFHDARTVDRGIPSLDGSPLRTDPSTFFGNPDVNRSEVTVNALSAAFETRAARGVTVRSRVRYATYDKFYQNLVPGAVNPAAATVRLSGYNSGTLRDNLFAQTDVVVRARTGAVEHVFVSGVELGRQETDNRRRTGFFGPDGASTTATSVPLGNPRTPLPVDFRSVETDANNDGVATVAAVFAQDQIALTRQIHAVLGVRYDLFDVDFLDRRSSARFTSRDRLFSPRVALLYKPAAPLSVYTSYARAYLPRAGEQLASLTLSNRALEPENFDNYEVGLKWDLAPALAFTSAVYRLDHGNVVVRDPFDPTVSHLVDAERTTGLELELTGRLSPRWTVRGGYAFQNGRVTHSISAAVPAGSKLSQVPTQTLSLWNRYDFTSRWGAALGVIAQSDSYVATDNTVVLPAFARVDGAVFFTLNRYVRAQLNVENVFDERYYAAAHNNNNITPGAPRALRIALVTGF